MKCRRKFGALYSLLALFGAAYSSAAFASPFDDFINACAIRSYSEETAAHTLEDVGWHRFDPRDNEWVISAITDGELAETMSWKTYGDPIQERKRIADEEKIRNAKHQLGQGIFLAFGDSKEALAIVWNPNTREQGLSCWLYAQRSDESDTLVSYLADIGGYSESSFSSKGWKWFSEPDGPFNNVQIDISMLNQNKFYEHFDVSPGASLKVLVIRYPQGNDT